MSTSFKPPSSVPIQVATGPMPPIVSESGNPLPAGWVRGTCGTCGGGVLVDVDGDCVDCASNSRSS